MPDENLPKDKDLPIEEHLAELRDRLIVIILAIGILTIAAYPFSDEIIFTFKKNMLPEGIKLIILNPIEYFLARAKLAALCALVVGVPLIVYEVFKFLRPGLFPNEEKFFLAVVPSSMMLFVIGAIFSYFTLTPLSLKYLVTYTGNVAIPALVLGKFISFITFMLLCFGLVFQMPLVIWLLIKAELMTTKYLKEKRRYAYGILLFGGFLVAPDPSPITPVLVAVSLIVMYELSIWLVDRMPRHSKV